MSKFYDALVNTDDGRKACIKMLNEQNITTPEDATIHQIAANIQLGVNGIDMWDTSYQLTDNAWKKAIKEIPALDTSKITSMYIMFKDCKSLKSISLLDTTNVTSMNSMFTNCSSLETIPQFNTSKVHDTSSMFSSCVSLTTVPQLDTSNVTDIREMFAYCKSLTKVPPLNIGKVTNMNSMFASCSSLKEIDISLAPILPSCNNMHYTFNGIPKDCLIKVYDEASKQKVLESRSDLTNVVVTGGK